MVNETLRASPPNPNADLLEQLERLSQRTARAALDAALSLAAVEGSGLADAAAKLARLSTHVVNAAQELEPTLAVAGRVSSAWPAEAAQLA